MKPIVELTRMDNNDQLEYTQLQCLDSNGEADYEVFEACWKGLSCISVDHLCLIFQAYGLIYPVEHSADIPRNNNYIIPCKLPEDIDNSDVYEGSLWTTFYFDFFGFLPNEIYYQLMCLALSNCKAQCSIQNWYSKRKCFFVDLKDTNWIIELEQKNQRLKFMVM